jgi:serine/threonine protein kinase
MGQVLLAKDRQLERLVALKVLSERTLGNLAAKVRMQREALSQAAVSHPNLLKIYDCIPDSDGGFILVLEYIPGASLERLIGGRTRSIEEVRRLAEELVGALETLHAAQIFHRDIKPANIMFRGHDGSAVLMDLGLAKNSSLPDITQTDAFVGTLFYSPPENIMSGDWDHRSDLFQLAATLLTALGWSPEVPNTDSISVMATMICTGIWKVPNDMRIPSPMRKALDHALCLTPGNRHDSCQAFLDEFLSGNSPRPKPAPTRPSRPLSHQTTEDISLGVLPKEAGFRELRRVGSEAAPSRSKHQPGKRSYYRWGVTLAVLVLVVPGAFWWRGRRPLWPTDFRVEPPELTQGGLVRISVSHPCIARWQETPEPGHPLSPEKAVLPPPSGADLSGSEMWTLLLKIQGEERTFSWNPEPIREKALIALSNLLGKDNPDERFAKLARERRDRRRYQASNKPKEKPPKLRFDYSRKRAKLSPFLPWIPILLQSKSSPALRRRLLEAVTALRRTVLQEKLLGGMPAPFRLPPGTSGSTFLGLPPWRVTFQTSLALKSIGSMEKEEVAGEITLTTGMESPVPLGNQFYSAKEIRTSWPLRVPDLGTMVCLSIRARRMRRNSRFLVSSPGSLFELSLLSPPSSLGKKESFWTSVCFPSDLAPPPGSILRLVYRHLLPQTAIWTKVQELRLSWSEPTPRFR